MNLQRLAALGLILFSGALAQAYPEIPVNDMTCAKAIRYVAKYERYYVRTPSGDVVPIYPVAPVSDVPSCKSKEIVGYHVRPTADQEACHLGYSCDPR